MRTTINISDEVMVAVKAISLQRRQTIGTVLSDLVRMALKPRRHYKNRNGVPLFNVKPDGKPVSLELINELRDEE